VLANTLNDSHAHLPLWARGINCWYNITQSDWIRLIFSQRILCTDCYQFRRFPARYLSGARESTSMSKFHQSLEVRCSMLATKLTACLRACFAVRLG